MSLNATETPIPVKIISTSFPPEFYIILAIILAFLALLFVVALVYKPRRIGLDVTRHPDGTYRLRYSWGWHLFGGLQREHHQTVASVEERIKEILEKTEWKKE